MRRFWEIVGWWLAAASLSLAGLFIALDTSHSQPPPNLVILPGGFIDATQPPYNVVPGADVTAGLRQLMRDMPRGTTILLPPGGLLVSGTCDFYTGVKGGGHVDSPRMVGSQTLISGNFAGPLVAYNAGGLDATASDGFISGIIFSNAHAQGIGLQLERLDRSVIDRCTFSGGNGLVIGALQFTNVDVSVRDCQFQGNLRQYPQGIGAALNMQGACYNCGFFQWGAGMLLGRAVSVYRGHAENNIVAIQTGLTYSLVAVPYSGVLSHVTMEANVYPVQILKTCYGVNLDAVLIHGTGNSITGQAPQIGIDVQPGSGRVSMNNVTADGGWQAAGIRLAGGGPVVAMNCQSSVKNAPGIPWVITMNRNFLTLIQSH